MGASISIFNVNLTIGVNVNKNLWAKLFWGENSTDCEYLIIEF